MQSRPGNLFGGRASCTPIARGHVRQPANNFSAWRRFDNVNARHALRLVRGELSENRGNAGTTPGVNFLGIRTIRAAAGSEGEQRRRLRIESATYGPNMVAVCAIRLRS